MSTAHGLLITGFVDMVRTRIGFWTVDRALRLEVVTICG
jgi:hypothetical protein